MTQHSKNGKEVKVTSFVLTLANVFCFLKWEHTKLPRLVWNFWAQVILQLSLRSWEYRHTAPSLCLCDGGFLRVPVKGRCHITQQSHSEVSIFLCLYPSAGTFSRVTLGPLLSFYAYPGQFLPFPLLSTSLFISRPTSLLVLYLCSLALPRTAPNIH